MLALVLKVEKNQILILALKDKFKTSENFNISPHAVYLQHFIGILFIKIGLAIMFPILELLISYI